MYISADKIISVRLKRAGKNKVVVGVILDDLK